MRYFILSIILSFGSFSIISGQNEETKPKLSYHGSLGLYGDFYHIEDAPLGSVQARRPAQLMRMRYTSRLAYGKWALPLDFILSTDGRSLQTAFPQGEALKDYVRDPLNRISLTPRFGSFEALLGSQVPRLSRLTGGDLQLFGAGFRWQPGRWVFQAFHGLGQRAFEADSSRHIVANFARNYSMFQVGYGKEETSHIRVNLVHGKDEVNSLENPEALLPAEGVTSSLSAQLSFAKGFFVKGEGAVSLFTRNLLYTGKFEVTEMPLMSLNLSSRMDGAAEVGMGRRGKEWSLELNSLYVGGGFEAMGYPFLQKDRLDLQVKGQLRLFDNKLNLNGSLGQRRNNVSGTQSADSRQLIGSFQMQANISKQLNLAASYANFGYRNTRVEDSLKLEFVSNSLSVTPSWQRQGEAMTHFLNLSFQADQYRDLNLVSGELRDNDTRGFSGMYRLGWITIPLSVDISGNIIQNELPAGVLNIRRVQLGMSYSLFQQKLRLGGAFIFSQNQYESFTADKLLAFRMKASYKLSKKLKMEAQARIRTYNYGSRKPDQSFQERLIRTSISYHF
jgi:hypothetical protein